ncbi:MAG: conserved repeat domain protein [Rhodoglobus sp.]|nr:conserved repeat domain protein [Rhodoglobus sp.]
MGTRQRITAAGAALAVVLGAGVAALAVPSPAAAVPVGCSADFYYVTANTLTKRTADGTLTPVSTGAFDPWTIALNPADGNLYAFPNSAPTGNHLFRVEADGSTTDLGAVTGLAAGILYSLGGFDTSGTLWTANSGTLYAVDVAALTATSVPLSGAALADFAAIDGMLYGQAGTPIAPRLGRVDPATGTVTVIPLPGLINATSVWSVAGHLYISQNTAIAEVLDYGTATPTLLQVATGLPSVPRDGASCATGASPFLNAADDDFTATPIDPAAGGTAGVVLGNDTRIGAAVVSADVTATVTADGGLTGVAIAADGSLTVPAGAAPGTYSVTYLLCAVATPPLCDPAVATVVVAAPAGPAPTVPASTPPTLPVTGVEADLSLWAALLLIGSGGVILAARRRASRGAAS